MKDLQSRGDIHVEMEDINAETVKLAATIKEYFEELKV